MYKGEGKEVVGCPDLDRLQLLGDERAVPNLALGRGLENITRSISGMDVHVFLLSRCTIILTKLSPNQHYYVQDVYVP